MNDENSGTQADWDAFARNVISSHYSGHVDAELENREAQLLRQCPEDAWASMGGQFTKPESEYRKSLRREWTEEMSEFNNQPGR